MRLTSKIILILSGLTLTVAIAAIAATRQVMNNQAGTTQAQWASSVTRILADSIARNTIRGDVLVVRELLQSVVRENADLAYAFVTDFDGRVFTHSFDGGFPEALLATVSGSTGTSLKQFQMGDRRIIDVAYPVVEGMTAYLHLGIDQTSAQQMLINTQEGIFLIAAGIILLGLAAAIALGRSIGRPLAQLASQMQSYGAGTLETPAIVRSREPEIQAILDSFNHMIRARRAAGTRLRESEADLKKAQAIAHLGSWRWDIPKGRLSWSDETYRILGLTPQEFGGTYEAFLDMVHPDDRQRLTNEVNRTLNHPEAVLTLEHRLLRPDGVERIVHAQGKVLRNDDGQPVEMIGTVQDITERKRNEKELERYRKHLEELVEARTATIKEQAGIIDQTHDSVITTDLDGHITSWNRGAERLFGFAAGEALGRHIRFVYPEEGHQFLADEVIAPLREKSNHEVEVRMRRADGTDFFAHLSLSMLYDDMGIPKGMVGYALDITERKQREALLHSLTGRLAAANQELEAFSYSVSHDLRAPLRAIDGFSQALVEDYGDTLDETAKDYLQRVRGGAQAMGQLIDDMLALSRVTRHELKYSRLDLSVLAERIVSRLRHGEPQRSVEVHIQPGLNATGDEGLARILLENILGNAWKYTGKTPEARIEFGSKQQDGEQVFFVRDNGAGFDMRYAGKLFGAFQRLHHQDEFPGTGIGLATAQRVVHRHGGRIWAEAETDRGACFYFTLPEQAEGHPVPPTTRG